MEDLLLDNCGCIVTVVYDYDELTLYLIEQYKLAGMPQPQKIYQAWDYVILSLKNGTVTAQPYFDRFEITGTEDEPDTVYNRPDLIGATILGVSIEGQGINESDPLTVNINTTTGIVTFRIGLTLGQYIKIDYKK